MKADAITGRIIEDAKTAAAQTLAAANARVRDLKEASEKSVAKARQQAMEQAACDAKELRERMLRVAELDQRKEQLAVKREVIDMAFNEAMRRMRTMPARSQQDYIETLILDAAEGDEALIVSEEDAGFYTEAFLARLNGCLRQAGRKGEIRLSDERRKLEGGFVLKRKGVEINCSYAAILMQLRPTMEAEVARILFAE